MRNKTLLILTLCFFSWYASAQDDGGMYQKGKYDYNLPLHLDTSEYHNLIDNEDSSFVLLDRTILSYEGINGNQYYQRKWISHKVYYIGNESDIEEINKLYLYSGSSSNSINVNVRTTTADGREIYLDESKMEDVSREDGAANYKILAISGIEKHSYVEVLVIRGNQSSHKRFSVSNPFPTKRAEVFVHNSEVVNRRYPKIKVRFNVYGSYEVESWLENEDEWAEFRKTFTLLSHRDSLLVHPIATAVDIRPSSNEDYSYEYEGYTYVDLVDVEYDWNEAGQGIGRNIFNELKYETNGRKYIKDLDLDEKSDLEKIQAIEKFIKEEIKETQSGDSEYSSTKHVFKKRIANETGIIKIADQMLHAAGLEYTVYLCSDKDYVQIDPLFAFTSGMDDILFYFPDLDVYMIPTNGYYYTGKIPNYLGSVNTLVIKDTSPSADLGEVIRLPDAKKEDNLDGTLAIIDIDPIDENCTVQKTKFLYGDRATRSRGYYHFSDDVDREDYVKEWLVDDLEMELSDVEIKNESIDLNFGSSDTVYYSGVLKGSDILSSIPNGFILNPGGIMGTQVSFYDTENRVSDIYVPESKMYDHTIIVNIPDGYTVEGTENLEFDEKYFANKRWLYGQTPDGVTEEEMEDPIAQFVSTVEVKDDQITIHIDEYYVEGFYPKEGLEDLQNVVNAAYEFFIAKIKLVEI